VRALSDWHATAPAVHAVEPDLPIVDCHHHLFGARQDDLHYQLDDLRQDLSSGHKVIGTVYVEAYESGWRTTGPESLRPVGEIEQINALTRSPLLMPHGPCQVAAGIVSHADLTLGDAVVEVLEHEMNAARGCLRGVRHRTATDNGTVGRFIVNAPRPHLMREPEYVRGVAQLQQFGLCLDAWLYHTQIDELIALADACPDTTMVLNHVGGVIGVAEFKPRRTEVLAYWQDRMRTLAQRPNVCVKLGGMGMPVFGFGFERLDRPPTAAALVEAWKPMIDFCIDAFGTQRCMFESNFPPDKQSSSYVELWNAFKLATTTLTRQERSDLFYRTACRVYRLPDLASFGDAWIASSSHDLASPLTISEAQKD
jgi:L-fuconolactonase